MTNRTLKLAPALGAEAVHSHAAVVPTHQIYLAMAWPGRALGSFALSLREGGGFRTIPSRGYIISYSGLP